MYWRTALGVLVLSCLLLGGTGCHHAFGWRYCDSASWRLDDATKVALWQRVSLYPSWADSELTYRELAMEVRMGDDLVHQQILRRCEGRPTTDSDDCSLDVEQLELRAAPDRQQFWVVIATTGRVVVAYDCRVKAATLYREPATWPEGRRADTIERMDKPGRDPVTRTERPSDGVGVRSAGRG